MLYLRNLRVALQERRTRLHRTDFQTYDDELRYFLQFLDENIYVRALLLMLQANIPVDFDLWEKELEETGRVRFPQREVGRAALCYRILIQCVDDNQRGNALGWGRLFSHRSSYSDWIHDFTEAVVDPFVNFLHDRIEDGGNVLHLIERFKLKVEWFRQSELYDLYKDNTVVGEARLDRELRASLFEGGIDYPFSEPSSPSGKADVIALLGSDDPLVLEVKVFDPEHSKNKNHLRQGFHQVLRYANDYNQNSGYLVIFNCSDRRMVISSGEASETEFPPRIVYGGKTFFVISIDIRPSTDPASKEKPKNRLDIDLRELVDR